MRYKSFPNDPEERQETTRERAERHRQERRAELTYTAKDQKRWSENRKRVLAEREANGTKDSLDKLHLQFFAKNRKTTERMILKSSILKESKPLNQLAGGNFHSIKKGASDTEKIRKIQEALMEMGFDLGKSGVDGNFGSTTESAIKKFQQTYQPTHTTHGSYQFGDIDGIVGKNTILAMDEALLNGWKKQGNDPELVVRAFMRMLRVGEGTVGEQGYETLFGGSSFISDYGKNWDDHPRKHMPFGKTTSTAAGAYQVMGYVWDDENMIRYRNIYGIHDFSPYNQDLFALVILKHKRKQAWRHLLQGDIKTAITLNSGMKGYAYEWASLPPGIYGQPNKTMEEAMQLFDKFLKEEQLGISDLKIKIGDIDRFLL
ncbi:MAG: peptidoglycan-binding protein [Vibrio sp.]|uniref:peptidoglycan-binding protein n=1 Tax=Vibrio TaxID=662 RepID=UPI001ED59A4B|nr:peptidoglycan-binding protein [Vibrio sp.]NRB68422.1 peptidoglycan-binding protein [Vibrio sp.]